MRDAKYDIDIGRPYFDFVCEFMIFMAMAADRIAYMKLDAERRAEFTAALGKRLAEIVEDNNHMLLGEAQPGECQQHFVDLFNRRGADYAEFDYGADGPDFGFKRYFAACLREGLPEKDRLWVVDQVMEIEVPDALKALDKTLAGLFGGGGDKPRRERGGRRRRLTWPRHSISTRMRAYAEWRQRKLDTAPRRLEDIVVEVDDPRELTVAERARLLRLNAVANMAIYVGKTGRDPDKDIPRLLGLQLGLHRRSTATG